MSLINRGESMKKYNLIIVVLLWAAVIFYASSKDSYSSNKDSLKFISVSVETCSKVTNSLRLTNIDLSSDNINKIALKLNYPVRKMAHFTLYFILGILLYYTFICFGLPKKSVIVVLLLCLIYTLSDEYHQLFSIGRSAKLSDCLIDFSGAICGCTLEFMIFKAINKRQIKSLNESNKNIN